MTKGLSILPIVFFGIIYFGCSQTDRKDDITTTATVVKFPIFSHNSVLYSVGTDGVYDTTDDYCVTYTKNIYNDDNQVVKIIYFSPGNDIIKDTTDDLMTAYAVIEYNDNGQIIKIVGYGSGDDMILFSEDDNIYSYSSIEYNGNLISKIIPYLGNGLDKEWLTKDDLIYYYTLLDYESNRSVAYTLGSDGIIDTADDAILGYTTYEYNKDTESYLAFSYYNEGDDGIWFTEDDGFNKLGYMGGWWIFNNNKK